MGESVQISCYVNKGDMPVDISWMFNGTPIYPERFINITPVGKKTSLLSIENVDQSHITTHTAELFVKGI